MKRYVLLFFSLTFVIAVFFNFKSANSGEKFSSSTNILKIRREQLPLNWPWRGVTIVSQPDTEKVDSLSIKGLKEKGVNFINLSLDIRKYAELKNVSEEQAINENFYFADRVIRWCKNEDIAVMLAYIQFPIDPSLKITQRDVRFWENPKLIDESIIFIGKFVQHFDHWENLVGYDFFSEPVMINFIGRSVEPLGWKQYYYRILHKVREHSKKFIIYSPPPWGNPQNFKDMNDTIVDNKIIYGFHFYEPHTYTHQGIRSYTERYSYPGVIDGKFWDKNEIKNAIVIPYEWSKRNNQLLYVGEFSVVNWAEGKEKYLSDVLSVFEEYKISYSYFSFNSWKGWDYDYMYDSISKKFVKPVEKTKTLEILEGYWGLNKKN